MDISQNPQPDYINIDETLRLRKFDNKYAFALEWYKNRETVDLVDGKNSSLYDNDKLKRMYNYLNNRLCFRRMLI